jgi:hypothetical protein
VLRMKNMSPATRSVLITVLVLAAVGFFLLGRILSTGTH